MHRGQVAVGQWLGRPRTFRLRRIRSLATHHAGPAATRTPELEINGKHYDYTKNEYGPDIVSDYALDFIQRKKESPFFLYYPMMLTHSPYDATPDSPD